RWASARPPAGPRTPSTPGAGPAPPAAEAPHAGSARPAAWRDPARSLASPPGHDRADGLGLAESLPVPEHQHRPLAGRQLGERPPYRVSQVDRPDGVHAPGPISGRPEQGGLAPPGAAPAPAGR